MSQRANALAERLDAAIGVERPALGRRAVAIPHLERSAVHGVRVGHVDTLVGLQVHDEVLALERRRRRGDQGTGGSDCSEDRSQLHQPFPGHEIPLDIDRIRRSSPWREDQNDYLT